MVRRTTRDAAKKNTGSADVPTALELERHSIDHSLFHTQEIGPFVLRH